LKSEHQEIKFQLDWLKRQVFGTKSEKFIPSDDLQEALDLGVVKNDEEKTDAPAKIVSYEKKQDVPAKP
jgi:hypothetical protein